MLKLGCHVGMSGKEMMLGSVRDAVSFGANTFMLYTGAPQNTRRKEVSELRVEEAHALMAEHGIDEFVVHAPYIINLANTVNPATYEIAVEFLAKEIDRATAMGSQTIVLHPGSHVGAGVDAGIASIVKGLNEVLTADTKCNIALETMAGKGNECGFTFEQLAKIYAGIHKKSRIGYCMDTCHIWDAGYDITHFDEVLDQFDSILGLENLLCMHINDSKNPLGAHKDRHENLGKGYIGFDVLYSIVHHPKLEHVTKILETPFIDGKAPYKEEISALR